MITLYANAAGDQPNVLENVNDFRQLLEANQFMALLEDDAKRICNVLGSAKTSYKPVFWRRKSNSTIYIDYIITVV